MGTRGRVNTFRAPPRRHDLPGALWYPRPSTFESSRDYAVWLDQVAVLDRGARQAPPPKEAGGVPPAGSAASL